ncbi:MAG TPA: hypothetical protein PKJ72_14870 [Deltaproteobacteria bacterium]|nr:hypothetical protein [Deltaproteobacteria bacterium]
MVEFCPESHTYTCGGERFPSVTQVLADLGFYGDAVKYFTEYKRDLGSFTHKAIELYLAGELDESTLDPAILPRLNAWRKFEAETGYVSSGCEIVMASESYRFAGTVDHRGTLNDRPVIIDVKTGVLMPATGIQLGGYEILDGTPGLKRYGLQLKEDGTYSLKEYKDRTDRGVFLSALSVYQWKQNNLRRTSNV